MVARYIAQAGAVAILTTVFSSGAVAQSQETNAQPSDAVEQTATPTADTSTDNQVEAQVAEIVTTYEAEITRLQDALADAHATIETLKAQPVPDSNDDEIAALKTKLSESQSNALGSVKQMAKLRTENDALRAQIEELTKSTPDPEFVDKFAALEARANQLEAEKADLESEIIGLKAQLQDNGAVDELADLQAKLAVSEDKLAEFSAQQAGHGEAMAALEEELNAKTTTLNETLDELDLVKQEMSIQSEKEAELQANLAQLGEILAASDARMAELNNALQELEGGLVDTLVSSQGGVRACASTTGNAPTYDAYFPNTQSADRALAEIQTKTKGGQDFKLAVTGLPDWAECVREMSPQLVSLELADQGQVPVDYQFARGMAGLLPTEDQCLPLLAEPELHATLQTAIDTQGGDAAFWVRGERGLHRCGILRGRDKFDPGDASRKSAFLWVTFEGFNP